MFNLLCETGEASGALVSELLYKVLLEVKPDTPSGV